MASETFTSKQTTVKADWCNDLDNLFYTIFGGTTYSSQVFTINGSGDVLITTDLEVGDYGNESDGININGVIYDPKLRVHDIGGTKPAQVVLHRHSTTLPAVLLGSRSNNDTASHTAVTTSQELLTIYASGYTVGHYDLFSSIEFTAAPSGTISATSSPGNIIFKTSPNGSNSLSTALTIDSSQNITLNHTTEDLKFVDSGSAASTEQDWIEVTVGGNQGYIRVYAAK